jgi:ATP-dependent Lon protease
MNTELPKEIAIHPITLLSIVDHYSRSVGVKKNKRIIGALLGKNSVNKITERSESLVKLERASQLFLVDLSLLIRMVSNLLLR